MLPRDARFCHAVLLLSPIRALGRLFRFELAILPGHKLIKHGPYSVVRHPSYTDLPRSPSVNHPAALEWIQSTKGPEGLPHFQSTPRTVLECSRATEILQCSRIILGALWKGGSPSGPFVLWIHSRAAGGFTDVGTRGKYSHAI